MACFKHVVQQPVDDGTGDEHKVGVTTRTLGQLIAAIWVLAFSQVC